MPSNRNLSPPTVGDPSNLDAMGLLASNKGKPMEAIVEQVRIYLLLEFQNHQRRRTTQEPALPIKVPSDEPNGNSNAESRGPLTSAQRVAASLGFTEISPDAFGREAKHVTPYVKQRCSHCSRGPLLLEFNILGNQFSYEYAAKWI
nr:ribonuclease TUDOR 2-like [Tanacetum cinerariifolium]